MANEVVRVVPDDLVLIVLEGGQRLVGRDDGNDGYEDLCELTPWPTREGISLEGTPIGRWHPRKSVVGEPLGLRYETFHLSRDSEYAKTWVVLMEQPSIMEVQSSVPRRKERGGGGG